MWGFLYRDVINYRQRWRGESPVIVGAERKPHWFQGRPRVRNGTIMGMISVDPTKPFRTLSFAQYKAAGRPITMLTSYDAQSARIFDAAGVDVLLVGDSLGMAVLGYDSTTQVTLDDIVRATQAVARGAKRALVLADLPFGTYEVSPEQAVQSSIELVRAGAAAVKLEGGRRILPQIEAIIRAGIAVVGHLGFTPQSENKLGGKRVQGRGDDGLEDLMADALALQSAGVSAIVVEMVPDATMRQLAERIDVPTIGIGAGQGADGQVLVWTDMAGVGEWAPRFSHRFGEVGQAMFDAASAYRQAVVDGEFPKQEHTF